MAQEAESSKTSVAVRQDETEPSARPVIPPPRRFDPTRVVIPPPRRFDPSTLRVQAGGQPSAEAPPAVPDLTVPAEERALGGGEPPEAVAEAEAAAAPPSATASTLLMKALAMEDSPVKVYGWLQNSYTGNANGRPANGLNFGVNPNSHANQWMGNQYYLIIENPIEQQRYGQLRLPHRQHVRQ